MLPSLTGQAEVTITKADGRQLKQVIDNDIAVEVYDALTDKMVNAVANPYPSAWVPDRIRVTLSNTGVFSSSNFTDDNIDGDLGTQYVLAQITGNQFTGAGSGGYVNKVEVLGPPGGGDQIIAVAESDGTGTGTTFTSSSNVLAAIVIDDDDKFDVTYKIKFQAAVNTEPIILTRLLGHINGAASDITITTFKLLTDDDPPVLISTGTQEVAVNSPSNYVVGGTARFQRVTPSPTTFEVYTEDGTVVITKDVSGDDDLDPSTWVELSTVLVPWTFTISRVTSGVT